MKTIQGFVRTAVLTGLVALPAMAAAEGRITAVSGQPQLVSADTVLPALRGSVLRVGDQLMTGRNGTAAVWMADDSMLALPFHTVLQLDEYQPPAAGAGSLVVTLEQGGLRSLTGAIASANPDGFVVRTPFAETVARGTDFTSVLCDAACAEEIARRDEDGGEGLFVLVGSGMVSVTAQDATLDAEAEQIVYVAPGAEPRFLDKMPIFVAGFWFEVEDILRVEPIDRIEPVDPIDPIDPIDPEPPASPS